VRAFLSPDTVPAARARPAPSETAPRRRSLALASLRSRQLLARRPDKAPLGSDEGRRLRFRFAQNRNVARLAASSAERAASNRLSGFSLKVVGGGVLEEASRRSPVSSEGAGLT